MMFSFYRKKENGMPACAGMTRVIIEKFALKKHRHTREGGCPIWLNIDWVMI
jgi:hypothetical protein